MKRAVSPRATPLLLAWSLLAARAWGQAPATTGPAPQSTPPSVSVPPSDPAPAPQPPISPSVSVQPPADLPSPPPQSAPAPQATGQPEAQVTVQQEPAPEPPSAPNATPGGGTEQTKGAPPGGNVTAEPAAEGVTLDSDGPVLDLAEEHDDPVQPASEVALSERRASASVFSALPGDHNTTTIGGYAQFNLTSTRRGFDGDFETRASLRRLVLLFSHHITDNIAAYTELEWENAIACSTCSGSVEVEQAYVDWQLLGDALTLRSGLVLIPMGLINLWHEPPIFHGVDRPQFDQTIIPTTWRELGVGVTGLLRDDLEYQLYVTTTVVPTLLGPNGLVGARQFGSNSLSNALAVSGRIDYEPLLGLSLSAAAFASDAGGNGDYFDATGERVDFTFPIWGGSLTARLNRRGWEARAVGAAFWMPEAGALMNARRQDGGLLFPNTDRTGAVPTRMQGGMVELAYDVLHIAESSHQLLPFLRAEAYDTQAAVPNAYRPNGALTVQEWTFGVSYRPIRQLVFKADGQLRDRRAGLDELQLNAGMGYML